MVELVGGSLIEVLGFDSETDLPTQTVTLSYGADDSKLSGEAYVGDLHPDNRRLTDLLNHGSHFLLLFVDGQKYLVNKRQMHFASVG